MDMKTTLGQTEAKARAEQVRGEILSALAEAGEPLTMRQLMDRCDSAESADQITKQIGNLKKSGEIIQSGTIDPTQIKRGAKPIPTYALAPLPEMALSAEEAERLAEYIGADLERKTEEMGEQASLSDTIDAVTKTAWAHVSHGAESHDGDEFEHAEHVCCGAQTKTDTRANFAARYIAALEAPEPRLLEGRWIADMLGAIAKRLEAGRALPPDPEAASLLREAEQILLEVSA